MAEIHTVVLTEKLIKPSTPTPATLHRINLSLLDRLSPSTYINVIYYYNPIINHPNPHHDQIRFHLQTSLSDTLTTFYPLAGRYVGDDRSVKCNDQGVGYAEVQVEGCRMVDFLDAQHLNQLVPFQGVKGPFPDGGGDHDGVNSTPLVGIQVNLFKCGGVAIGVCVWHKIADAFTAVQFINAWAKANNLLISGMNNRSCRSSGDDDDDRELQLQRLSFNEGSFFPVKNFLVEIPLFDHDADMKVVTRRFVFNEQKVSSLRTEFKEYYTNGGGVSLKTPSRVTLVTAVLWKALMGAAAENRHTGLRPSVLAPAISLRGRTSFPAISDNSLGNFWRPFLARFNPNSDQKTRLSWQDLVHPITDAMRTTVNSVQQASREEISSATIQAWKELHDAMAGGEHGEVDAFICTSWCRFALNEADFGWGKPAWVSSNNRPYELFVLMDSSGGDDGIDAWVYMDQPIMQLLQQDPDIIAFTST